MPQKKQKNEIRGNAAGRRGILEHLFGSRTRAKLLKLFLSHPGRPYYVRELGREVGAQVNAVRRELERFVAADLLRVLLPEDDLSRPQKKFYVMDESAPLFSELRILVAKSQIFIERDMVSLIKEAGRISAIFFCGAFINDPRAVTDILIIGRIDRGELRSIMEKFGKEAGFDIKYTVMTPAEFKYRRDVADRFVLSILDGLHILGYNALPELLYLSHPQIAPGNELKNDLCSL